MTKNRAAPVRFTTKSVSTSSVETWVLDSNQTVFTFAPEENQAQYSARGGPAENA
jgi:hypothetical protein